MGARLKESRLALLEPFVCQQMVFTPSEDKLRCHLEYLIDGKWSKADGRKWVHGVPLSRWWGCFGVLGVGGM